MAPLEPWEKVLVSEKFFGTEHGEISCRECHGGDPASASRAEAHEGVVRDPTIKDAPGTCGECHEEIVETGTKSLHATLSTFSVILEKRSGHEEWEGVDTGRKNHCAGCHSSCGQCHVSRPKFAKNGLIDGHLFNKTPDMMNQCTACHGSRVGDEYYGNRGMGDIHISAHDMSCEDCHSAGEMHASGEGLEGRYLLPEIAQCTGCHEDLNQGPVEEHEIHVGTVQCQICHSQSYVNCYSCHVGKDSEGLGYFQNERETEGLKIGKAYPGSGSEEKFILVRHAPVDKEVFDFYQKEAFPNFDALPNWKRTSPHNIQRRTWQSATCNNCHGNRELFLSAGDLLDYEQNANREVIVADDEIPEKRDEGTVLDLPLDKVRNEMVVTAEWLKKNLKRKGLVVVDARGKKEYRAGHIEGAIRFDPLAFGLRSSWNSPNPMTLIPPEKIMGSFGKAGLSAKDQIIVYDKNGRIGGFLLWVLEYVGAERVAYLNGGVEAWEESGYHLSTEIGRRRPVKFGGIVRPELIADSDHIRANLEKPELVVLDARIIPEYKGWSKHERATRAGCIPGAVSVPIGTFYMENGQLKSPQELIYVLQQAGVTPEKSVITTPRISSRPT